MQEISWTEEPGGLQFMGLQESDTTQQLNSPRKETTVGGLGIQVTFFLMVSKQFAN